MHQSSYANRLKLFILFFLLILLFAPTLLRLIRLWYEDPDYSHGFFVIPIALFLVWHKREQLSRFPKTPSWMGLPVFLFGILIYYTGFVTNFHSLMYISMMLVIFGLLIFNYGWQRTKIIFFPVFFLVFMFPIPSSIYIMVTNPLKLFITDISATIIRIFDIPVYQDGNLLYFENTRLEIAEACSGIRSMFSYAMLGIVFSFFCKRRFTKFFLIFSAIPLAIIVNIIRVSTTGILSHYFGEKAAQGFFHEFAGMALFLTGLVLMLCIYYLVEDRSTAEQN